MDAYLKKLEKTLQRARNKELGIDENEGKVRFSGRRARLVQL